jgi:LPXTG-site transpeptidase (sortase) family protein
MGIHLPRSRLLVAVLTCVCVSGATMLAGPAAANTAFAPKGVQALGHTGAPFSDPRPAHGRSVNLAEGSGSTVPTPTALSIPAIGVATSLVELGLNPDGSAAVPASTSVAGWYASGPRPGQPGPAVILGHVDSYTGPGVFFRLKDLQSGDMIKVSSGAQSETFVVQSVELVSKDNFPTSSVFGPTPQNALRLVTCGGPFDSSIGSYEDNWVVYASEVA